MNTIFFTGNVGNDAEHRSTGSGDVCNFSVAVKQGFGQDAPTAWYRVEVWGKRASTLAPLVTKGAKVAVCGELVIDEYQGKPQYRVKAHEVDPFCGGKREEGGRQERQPAPAGDFDDDVPF